MYLALGIIDRGAFRRNFAYIVARSRRNDSCDIFSKEEEFLRGIMALCSEDVAEYVAGVICDCHKEELPYVTIRNVRFTEVTEAVKMAT